MDYIAAGGNRHPSASDWHGETLAYGADRNIALWRPQVGGKGVTALLGGHTDTVNVLKFLPISSGVLLLSGSVDKTIRVWHEKDEKREDASGPDFECTQILGDHEGSLNCIAVCPECNIFASGSADATIRIWRVACEDSRSPSVILLQTILPKPKFFPLSLALSSLPGQPTSYVLAAAGTSTSVQLYATDKEHEATKFELRATLTGHEGWIRSLAFVHEASDTDSDLLLASASQDKYTRLWRIHRGKTLPAAAAKGNDPALGAFLPGKSLSNKAHRFKGGGDDYSATFEALLLGHEDWIYSASWQNRDGQLRLLTASADNSLAIWRADEATGVWVTTARLGEISAQKGSTTATGSTGGFWAGLWAPDGRTVVCLGRTGSWRIWNYDGEQDRWMPGIGISGHTKAVNGIAWSRDGEYLISTSSDQTSRLHAKWVQNNNDNNKSWHEMSRPQIHGYDLNCLDTLGDSKFVSGADEKLLRVFEEPKAVAGLLERVSGIKSSSQDMPDAANIPVLGLSNKAIDAVADDVELAEPNHQDREAIDPASVLHKSTLAFDHPPLEDHLSRHTLWPEIEKLYGHGYEICTLAGSHDGSVVATACKASSIDHAVIRLFETKEWREIKPPLTAHSLTVTRLRFSPTDRYLLSVGRDRQWALFERQAASTGPSTSYQPREANAKAHTRMILDCAWVPGDVPIFVTAGRDKQVKIWRQDEGEDGFHCKSAVTVESAVTAVDIASSLSHDDCFTLAVGTDTGSITIYSIDATGDCAVKSKVTVDTCLCPTKSITQLAWQPQKGRTALAVASEDSSLRILTIEGILPAPTDAGC